MKKTLKALLAMTMVFSLYGCSSKEKDVEEDTEKVEETTNEETEKEETEEKKENTAAEDKKKKEEELAKKRAEESSSQSSSSSSSTYDDYSTSDDEDPLVYDVDDDDTEDLTQTLVESDGPYKDQSEALSVGSKHMNEVRIENNAKSASFTIERNASGEWMINYYVYK